MGEQKYSIDRDLKEAEAMADSLASYVRQNELYGQAGRGFFSNMPSLTVGALLTRLRRLDVLRDQMSGPQRQKFSSVQARHDQVAREWQHHYEGKLTREANSRLDAMRPFFEECASDPRLCARVYMPETLRRTIAQECLDALGRTSQLPDELRDKARNVDGSLRRIVRPSAFVWDAALKQAYPQEIFWWLYHQPPTGEEK
jgi:hypothetical protein